jgi:hypothetical protein
MNCRKQQLAAVEINMNGDESNIGTVPANVHLTSQPMLSFLPLCRVYIQGEPARYFVSRDINAVTNDSALE